MTTVHISRAAIEAEYARLVRALDQAIEDRNGPREDLAFGGLSALCNVGAISHDQYRNAIDLRKRRTDAILSRLRSAAAI